MSIRVSKATLANLVAAFRNCIPNFTKGQATSSPAITIIPASKLPIGSDGNNGNNGHSTQTIPPTAFSPVTLIRLQSKSTESAPTHSTPRKIKLDNGLTIIAQEIPGATSCNIIIQVNCGSMYEDETNNGIAHFVEHMAFGGTKTRTKANIERAIDELGTNVNAFTDYEHTYYEASVLSEHALFTLGLLLDMVLNQNLDEEQVEREKGVILQEIRKYRDAPEDYVSDHMYEVIWKDHPLGKPIVGTEQTISRLNKNQLEQFLKDFYTLDNITISVAGKFNINEIIEQAQQSTINIHSNRKRKEITLQPPSITPGISVKSKPIEQTHLIFATQGISVQDEDQYIFSVLEAALCVGSSSRLFREIRGERGLAYDVCASSANNSLGGFFAIQTAIPGGELGLVLDLILKELKDIKDNGLRQDELESVKTQLINEIKLGHESAEAKAETNLIHDYFYKRFIPIQEVIQGIQSVTNEDIIRLAKEIFNPKYFTLGAVGPKKEMPAMRELKSVISKYTQEWEQRLPKAA